MAQQPDRVEIARYLLARGLDPVAQVPSFAELADPPHWAVVRNMSDPVINGELPAMEFHLNQQTTWAVGYYTAYGKWTSIIGALTAWGIVAGL